MITTITFKINCFIFKVRKIILNVYIFTPKGLCLFLWPLWLFLFERFSVYSLYFKFYQRPPQRLLTPALVYNSSICFVSTSEAYLEAI